MGVVYMGVYMCIHVSFLLRQSNPIFTCLKFYFSTYHILLLLLTVPMPGQLQRRLYHSPTLTYGNLFKELQTVARKNSDVM